MQKFYFGFWAIISIFLANITSAENTHEETLYASINARLAFMKPVAAWKLERGMAVENLEREAVVLVSAIESAAKNNLEQSKVRDFFAAQILAAKNIQYCWIEKWNNSDTGFMGDAPDLVNYIRPKLLDLGNQINTNIEAFLQTPHPFTDQSHEKFAMLVDVECLSKDARDKMFIGSKQTTLAAQ